MIVKGNAMVGLPKPAVIRIAAAITCFNRRKTTMRCLTDLLVQQDAKLQIDVYLLDDASTDGTAQDVAGHFPQVRLLNGTGSRFWSGGMADAMAAAAAGGDYDFFLLLNDDVMLMPDALQRIVAAHDRAAREKGPTQHIIVGAFNDPETGTLTYTGFVRARPFLPVGLKQVVPLEDDLARCDTMNGNCVLIPAEIVRRIGVIDPVYVHQLGDLDYGFRAVKAGAQIWVAPSVVGSCAIGPHFRRWENPGLTAVKRWELINHPKGWPLKPWFHYMWRHGGVIGVMTLIASYVKAVLGLSMTGRQTRPTR